MCDERFSRLYFVDQEQRSKGKVRGCCCWIADSIKNIPRCLDPIDCHRDNAKCRQWRDAPQDVGEKMIGWIG